MRRGMHCDVGFSVDVAYEGDGGKGDVLIRWLEARGGVLTNTANALVYH